MMTRGANNALPETLLCRQMISVEIGGRSQQLQVLYDSGATLTLITHEAAADQERIRTQRGRGALQLLLYGAHGGLQ